MFSVKTLLVASVATLTLGVAGVAMAANAVSDDVTVLHSDGVVLTNTGEYRSWVFEGHDLAGLTQEGGGILYAPSEADDPGYRAAISAAAGGATVDYFDARAGTPSVAVLSGYDCVYVWANFAFADNVGFGNNLAAANDAGVDVVLGSFCTFTSGNFLSGAIMGAGYCPVVSPTGTNHFSASSYVGDGTSCIYAGVASLTCNFRDFLVTQGTGVVDGTYGDGEICHAYRSGGAGGDVVYSNGSGAAALGCPGDWAQAVANACTCGLGGPGAWTDEGFALAGVQGDPLLVGTGSLAPFSPNVLTLSNAAPNAVSHLLANTTSSLQAFKGGTLVPTSPLLFNIGLATDASRGWVLKFHAPDLPSGFVFYCQAATVDAAAVAGVSLSNGVKGTTP
jgi:hypothetical protein